MVIALIVLLARSLSSIAHPLAALSLILILLLVLKTNLLTLNKRQPNQLETGLESDNATSGDGV